MGKKKRVRDTENPYTLLVELFREEKLEEFLEVLGNIYVFLCRKAPPRSLKKQWRKEVYSAPFNLLDFTIKYTGEQRCYHIRLDTRHSECWLEYSNPGNAIGIDGHKSLIARRARQLTGIYDE